MRWAARRDKAEPAVVQALEFDGWTVVKVSAPGFMDLFCVRREQVAVLEVKSKHGRLTPAQVALHARLRAAGLIVGIVTTPEEARAAVRGEVRRSALTEPAVRPRGAPRSFAELATPNTRRPRKPT